MMIRKQNNSQPGRRKAQWSSDRTEENGKHTEETQHGRLNNGLGQKMEVN